MCYYKTGSGSEVQYVDCEFRGLHYSATPGFPVIQSRENVGRMFIQDWTSRDHSGSGFVRKSDLGEVATKSGTRKVAKVAAGSSFEIRMKSGMKSANVNEPMGRTPYPDGLSQFGARSPEGDSRRLTATHGDAR